MIGAKKPTNDRPVHSENTIQTSCLRALRATLSVVHGALSSFMRLARSPSIADSIQTNTSVQTVCGQA